MSALFICNGCNCKTCKQWVHRQCISCWILECNVGSIHENPLLQHTMRCGCRRTNATSTWQSNWTDNLMVLEQARTTKKRRTSDKDEAALLLMYGTDAWIQSSPPLRPPLHWMNGLQPSLPILNYNLWTYNSRQTCARESQLSLAIYRSFDTNSIIYSKRARVHLELLCLEVLHLVANIFVGVISCGK